MVKQNATGFGGLLLPNHRPKELQYILYVYANALERLAK